MFDPAHAAVAVRAQRFVFWDNVHAAALLPHGLVEVDDRRAVVKLGLGQVELVGWAHPMPADCAAARRVED